MRITRRVEYCVRALVALAIAEPDPVKAKVLAGTEDIPPGYLYDLLAEMRRVELVYAVRGHHGGYGLTRPAAEITLGEVVRLLDSGSIEPLAREPDPATQDGLPARLRQLWDAANDESMRLLDEVSIADFVSDRQRMTRRP